MLQIWDIEMLQIWDIEMLQIWDIDRLYIQDIDRLWIQDIDRLWIWDIEMLYIWNIERLAGFRFQLCELKIWTFLGLQTRLGSFRLGIWAYTRATKAQMRQSSGNIGRLPQCVSGSTILPLC